MQSREVLNTYICRFYAAVSAADDIQEITTDLGVLLQAGHECRIHRRAESEDDWLMCSADEPFRFSDREIAVRVSVNDQTLIMNFFRNKTQVAFSSQEISFLKLLYPHFRYYAMKVSQLERKQRTALVWKNTFDHIQRPVWVISRQRQFLYENHVACSWRKRHTLFDITAGEFHLCNPDDQQEMIKVLSLARDKKNSDSDHSLTGMTFMVDNRRESFWLSPLSDQAWMVAGKRLMPDSRQLRTVFGLTRRQAQFCTLLMNGLILNDAASEMGVSVNTARNMLMRCFRILNVSSQAGMIRTLNAGVTFMHADQRLQTGVPGCSGLRDFSSSITS